MITMIEVEEATKRNAIPKLIFCKFGLCSPYKLIRKWPNNKIDRMTNNTNTVIDSQNTTSCSLVLRGNPTSKIGRNWFTKANATPKIRNNSTDI